MITRKKIMGLSVMMLTFISLFSTIMQSIPVSAAIKHQKSDANGRVLLLTNRDPKEQSPVAISLGLDDRINLTVFGMDDDTPSKIQEYNMKNFDVVICDSFLPNATADQLWLKTQMLANNVSLLFFGGNYTADLTIFGDLIPAYFNIQRTILNASISTLILGSIGSNNTVYNEYLEIVYNNTKTVQIMQDSIQVAVEKEEAKIDINSPWRSIFTKNIAWQSCPLLLERVFTYSKKNNTKTLVEVPNTQEPLVVIANISDFIATTSKSKVLFISTGVGNITFYEDRNSKVIAPISKEMNTPFKLWPYFNYLMYLSVFYLDVDFDHDNLESYADWPWSPIPHEREATIWMIFVASLWVFNFTLFFTLGKKKKAKDLEDKNKKPTEIPLETPKDGTTPKDETIPPTI